jgi:iron complex outermembrane receptor protein
MNIAMRFFAILLFLAAIFHSTLFAQNGSITGSVRDENSPLGGIKLNLRNTILGAITDKQGKFTIPNITPGTYTLTASGLGFKTQTLEVIVNAGSEVNVAFAFTQANFEMQNVEITGRRESSYRNTASFVGTKTATLLKDVPQSISYVTKELIADRQAYRLGDIVKNMSGINQFSFYNDFTKFFLKRNSVIA